MTTKLPDLPAVPTTLDRGTRVLLDGMRQHLRELRGFQGDPNGRALTVSEGGGGGGTVIVVPGNPGNGGSTEPDPTPPPTPEVLQVDAGIDFLFYKTKPPVFSMGHGYARTKVYGAKWPATQEVGPTFANAVLIDEFVGEVGSSPTDPATRWCVWLTWVTRDGVESVTPSGGTNGHVATTGQDPTLLLKILTGQIKEDQLYAALGDRIKLIDAPDTMPGSVAARIKSEATTRANADNAISSIVDQVSATVDGNTAAIQTEATTRANQTGQLFAQYTVKLDVGGKVSGYGLASSSASSTFAIRADRFYIAAPAGVGGVNDVVPFAVQATPTMTPAGELLPAGVYIDAAYVRNLEVALGRFQNAFITNAMVVSLSASRLTSGVISVGNYIQSSNYVPGVQGWRISGDGFIEVDAAWIRGLIRASQIDARGLTIRKADGTVILDAGAAVPIPSSMVNPALNWLNSSIAVGTNLVPNSDYTKVNTCSYFVFTGTVNAPKYASLEWSSNYVLVGGNTRNLFVYQDGRAAGDDGTTITDIYPMGPWSMPYSAIVSGGQMFCASAYLGAHRCGFSVGLQFFDANGARVGNDFNSGYRMPGTQGNLDRLNLYDRVFVITQAPVTAVAARMYLRKYNTNAGEPNSYMWWAAPQLEQVGATATGPGPYSPGPVSAATQLGVRTFSVRSEGNGSGATRPWESGVVDNDSGQVLQYGARSYNVYVWNRDGSGFFARTYDVYGSGASGGYTIDNLIADLNYIADAVEYRNKVIGVYTDDEPLNNAQRLDLQAALSRHGATRANFLNRLTGWSAYILVGVVGCGEGKGVENTAGEFSNDPKAWCEVSFQLINGAFVPSGAKSGTRSVKDLDFTGDLNADSNSKIGINSSGQIYGVGAGSGIPVSNNQMSMGADGVLYNGGSAQGRIEQVAVIDNGAERVTNRPPDWYGTATRKEFKLSSAIGLQEGDGYWCTLETIKQYPDNSGGYAYQYAYQNGKTWRRSAPVQASNWGAWVQDLDRAAYTGDLDATKGANIGTTLYGSFDQNSFDVVMAGRTLIRDTHIIKLSAQLISTGINGGTASGIQIVQNILSVFTDTGNAEVITLGKLQ